VNTRTLSETPLNLFKKEKTILKINSKHMFVAILSLIFAIIGFVLLIRSSVIGFQAAERFLANRGGMDTNQFNILITNYIETYRWLGAILLTIGIASVVYIMMRDDFWERNNENHKEQND
jgi:hypothetical protein